jgi:TPR repeat protein
MLAAKQGHAESQANIGLMYGRGRGVPQSDEEAVKWYRLAAEQGDADGLFNLAVMYDDGRGVAENRKKPSGCTALPWHKTMCRARAILAICTTMAVAWRKTARRPSGGT